MATTLDLDLNGFMTLFTHPKDKVKSSPQHLFIGTASDLKGTFELKLVRSLVLYLNTTTVTDAIQKQLVDVINKSKLTGFYGSIQYMAHLPEELKKLYVFGFNDGLMHDILPSLSAFKCLTAVGLWTLSIDYVAIKTLLESTLISTVEIINVCILNVPLAPIDMSFVKEKLVWKDTNAFDESFSNQSIMGATKQLDTDNIMLLSCLKGNLKLLQKIELFFQPVDARQVAKSLILAKNIVDVLFKCPGINQEQTRMILTAITSEKVEKLVLIPCVLALQPDDFQRFKNLTCFGAISLPFDFIKTLKLTSFYLHTLESSQYAQLNAAIQSYQIKNVYFSGLPSELTAFEEKYSDQLSMQGCRIHIINK